MVNTSILQHLPPFLGEEFASIVSTENVQLLTSLLFHKYQPLLECSEGITFAFQKCNPYCNGYNTLTDILYIQPQSLFSISVYLYLLTDFSPFTTTSVLVPLLLHNRKRFSVLVGLVEKRSSLCFGRAPASSLVMKHVPTETPEAPYL